jgi:8-oxo-dGTP pyrophosphatase MutT (NUDIX family)
MPIEPTDMYRLIFEEHHYASDFRAKIISAWLLLYAALAAGLAWAQANPNSKPVSWAFSGLALLVTALMWSADFRHRTALRGSKIIGKTIEEASASGIPVDQRYFALLADRWFTHTLVIDVVAGLMFSALAYATYILVKYSGDLNSIFPRIVWWAGAGTVVSVLLYLRALLGYKKQQKTQTSALPARESASKLQDDRQWNLVSAELVYKKDWMTIQEKRYRVGNDTIDKTFPVVERSDFVLVVAIDVMNQISLVRQYRQGTDQSYWGVPAGYIEDGESTTQAALRELHEEAGFFADKAIDIGELHPLPGYIRSKGFVVLCEVLRPDLQYSSDGEIDKAGWIPIERAVDKILSGEIKEMQAVAAILLVREWLGKRRQAR